MQQAINSVMCKTKLMMASIKTVDDILYSMNIGACAVTAPWSVIQELSNTTTQTDQAIKMFSDSWSTVNDDLFIEAVNI